MTALATAACIVLVSQQPGNDVPMRAAVESFVAASGATPAGVLDPAEAVLLDGLGADSWRARERATRELAASGSLRVALWAAMSGDPEVRLRGQAILDGVWRCWSCRGAGRCGVCAGRGWTDRVTVEPCTACRWSRSGAWLCAACEGTGEPRR